MGIGIWGGLDSRQGQGMGMELAMGLNFHFCHKAM